MESKLPKPSALKRPAPVARTILPTDRIKTASFTGSFGNKTHLFSGSSQSLNTFNQHPRDITNFQNYENTARRERAASPEAAHSNYGASRAKMRRSRSACDIRDMRPLKRTESTLAPIPAKTSRLLSSTATIGTVGANTNRPPRIGMSTTATSSTTTKKPPTANTSKVNGGGRTALNNTKGSSNTSANTSASAAKTASKRIPAYDFKARFNDLLEKHKILKDKLEEKTEQLNSLENLPEVLEDTEKQLITTKEELKNTQTMNECLKRETKLLQEKYNNTVENLSRTTVELNNLTKAYTEIKQEHAELISEVNELRERTSTLADKNANLMDEIAICKEQLFRSNMERKELHNTVLDLRGNIRVFCRVRPPLDCERDKMLCNWSYLDEATVEIASFEPTSKGKPNAHTFTFDQVFHPSSGQESIFEMVSPLIQSALDGYNICIFAYGQTGSGKTYTMDGIPSNPGVIPRTVDLLFDSIKNYRHLGWEYEIKVTFLEIYNEVLYDLLSNEQKDMEIRMVKNSKNDIYVSNITQETVESAGRLRELMQIAKMNRATAATVGNERSSRSHAVTKIELIGAHAEKQEISIGSINLVDLAGSESPKTSTRMNETKNINRSLSELTNVILALLQKQDHIPYRNSKLTHLLMPSLGGNSKTLMFINVAPLQDCFVESLKSLRFAATVNQCKMAKAKRNRILNTSLANTSGISNQ
ncbi:protein claret segregational [Musca vetustissima]|uniref:protein claret segregational n=1 Tax=Musca vetustissima TaxID=27455 RepID=UPI002AB5FEFC|nr:protein claret segregational [Musca vetustissima]